MTERAKPVAFIEFWQFIASELGNSRLKIQPRAESIHSFIVATEEQRGYLRDAIKQSYKLSRCNHLGSPIDVIKVLDILGEAAYQLQVAKQDDLFDIELLEEIAWYISQRYADHFDMTINPLNHNRNKTTAKPTESEQGRVDNVISLPNAKIRRANTRL